MTICCMHTSSSFIIFVQDVPSDPIVGEARTEDSELVEGEIEVAMGQPIQEVTF